MPSNPGQNLHLVSSQIHAVASSSHLANSSSQLVVLSSYLVESWSHLVVSSILLTSPLLVYSSVTLQLVVSPFNSSCRTSTRRSLFPFSISVYPFILKPWSCLITNCGNNKTVLRLLSLFKAIIKGGTKRFSQKTQTVIRKTLSGSLLSHNSILLGKFM